MTGIAVNLCGIVIEKTCQLACASAVVIEAVIIALVRTVLIGCAVNTRDLFVVHIVIELFTVRAYPTVEGLFVK